MNNNKVRSFCILTTSYPTWNERTHEVPAGKFVHDMAKYLVKAGIKVHVVTMQGGTADDYQEKDGVRIHRFHYFVPGYETLTKGHGIPENIKKLKNKVQLPFYFLSMLINAYRIIRKYNIDIINAHWGFPTGFIGAILREITGKNLVTTLYGAELFPVLSGNMKYLAPLLRYSLDKADRLAGISLTTVNAAKQLCSKPEIAMIPDGIDTYYYKPGIRNEEILEKYGCKGKRVIFFTGRMVERKGHFYLLESMKYVRSKFNDIKLILGGHGPLYENLFIKRREWDLESMVEMPGFLPEEDIVPLLQSSYIYVLPSCIDKNGDTEGSATAAFEAMACSTPAIISYVGGNIGSIRNAQGAYYFETANSEDLSEKISTLLSDDVLYAQNKNISRNFILDNYSWESSINKYISLIEKTKE
jgi:L-malate glycosyltransferase